MPNDDTNLVRLSGLSMGSVEADYINGTVKFWVKCSYIGPMSVKSTTIITCKAKDDHSTIAVLISLLDGYQGSVDAAGCLGRSVTGRTQVECSRISLCGKIWKAGHEIYTSPSQVP